jgi:hypothetical protein
MEPHASRVVTAGMAGIAVVVAGLFVVGVHRAYRDAPNRARVTTTTAIATAAWMLGTWGVAASGRLARFDAVPPPFALLFVALVAVALGVGLSPLGARLSRLPLAALVGFHAFRLPLELVMHRAAAEGVMPPQMTYTGRNLDIVTGVTAVVVAALVARGSASRRLLWAWNALGAALLVNIMVVAVASLPMFHVFGSDPRHLNTWVAYPPFVWLPAVLVAAALAGHIVVTRRLLSGA